MSSNHVYLVFVSNTDYNTNIVEGVFANHKAAHDWVIANGALSADIYGNSELLRSSDGWWDVIKRSDGIYVKTGQVISIHQRSLRS